MTFDIKTLMLLYLIINLISAGAMAIIWRQNRNRFAGISLWLVNMIFQAAGSLSIILRGVVPDFISIVLANMLVVSGIIILFIGLERFVDKKGRQFYNYILLAVYFSLIIYYSSIQPNMTMRAILISAMIIIFTSQIIWLLFRRVDPGLRLETRITGIVLGSYVVVSFVRIILLIFFPLNTSDFFKSNFVDSISIIFYIMISTCLTISLILMVNNRLLRAVQVHEEKFTIAFHSSPYAITLTKFSDGVIFEVNDGFVNMSGYQYEEAVGKTSLELGLWERDDDRIAVIKELSKSNPVRGIENQFRKKSGDIIIGLFSANIITINNEECILSSTSDITELSEMKYKLQVMATHDALTGLPNRMLFYDRFDIALAYAQRKQKRFAVMSLDLDNFKTINDTLGHDVGDKVLVAAADRLTVFLRAVDTVARFGGDEFVLLLWEIDSKDDAIIVAQKIIAGFQQLFIIDEHKLNLTFSIGIALYPEDGNEINDLIKKSDEALYYVKEHGRNSYQFYDEL